jgi:type 1 glutamine amidotransferase
MPAQHVNLLAFGDGDPDQHGPYVDAALMWLDQLKAAGSLSYTYINGPPDPFTDSYLAQYDVIYQVNYPPFDWSDTAEAAFQKYLTDGVGGWVGVHHSSLYGPEVQPTNEVPWTWFDDNLLGGINFVDYIATFAAGTVHVEDTTHPIFNGVPSSFLISKEEWYTWDKSPRPNVHVLANVDENSYMPPSDKKMGDHPVIWTNPNIKGKNVYIFMGHDPVLFDSTEYKTLLRNAIFWAGTK